MVGLSFVLLSKVSSCKPASSIIPSSCHIYSRCRYCRPCLVCRLCKLAPEVEKALAADNTKVVLTFAGAPERTMCLLFHVEGGLYVVSVGGFEGLGPSGCGEEEVLKFASEVREAWLKFRWYLTVQANTVWPPHWLPH